MHCAGHIEIPYETASALRATFHLNDIIARAQHGWGAIAAPCHDSQAAAPAAALHSMCLSRCTTATVLQCHSAVPALVSVLALAPASRQAFPAWLALHGLIRHCLACRVWTSGQLSELHAAAVPALVAVLARCSPGAVRDSTQGESIDGVRITCGSDM